MASSVTLPAMQSGAWPLIMLNVFNSALTKNHQLYPWQSAGSEQPIIAQHFSQIQTVETNRIFSSHLKNIFAKNPDKIKSFFMKYF